jgi:hypothetical protein
MTAQRSESRNPIEVWTRFERFPASLKGAFVMRGADGNPHSVKFDWARVMRVPSGPDQPVPIEDRQIDVGPSRDLFVPFEAIVSELDPSWYVIRSSLQVDAGRSFVFSSRLFSIPWARSDLRRGSFRVGASVSAGARTFHIDLLDLRPDAASVIWREEGEGQAGGVPQAALMADGAQLDILPEDPGLPATRLAPGEHRTVSYPVPRSTRSLQVVMRTPSGERSGPLPVRLL